MATETVKNPAVTIKMMSLRSNEKKLVSRASGGYAFAMLLMHPDLRIELRRCPQLRKSSIFSTLAQKLPQTWVLQAAQRGS
jgi:hypothetical protein